MARKTESISIRGRTFEVTAMTGMKQLSLLPRISELVGALLSKAGPILDNVNGKTDISDLVKVLPSFEEVGAVIADKLNEKELDKLTRDLLASTTVVPLEGGDKQALLPILDVEMSGEMLALLELLWFAVKVNYGDFSSGLGALVRKATKAAPSKSEG